MAFNKTKRRQTIKYRIRKKINGTAERPRLSVYRSNKGIYGQIIDDVKGVTIAAVSTLDKDIKEQKVAKSELATLVGKKLAQKALEKKIESVVFDRNGYLYHGRVKALADGAREGGLKL